MLSTSYKHLSPGLDHFEMEGSVGSDDEQHSDHVVFPNGNMAVLLEPLDHTTTDPSEEVKPVKKTRPDEEP